MILGKGMIATAFYKYSDADNVIIFSSGVSNSNEVSRNAFNREENLFLDTIGKYPNALFIYFSSCGTKDGNNEDSKYYSHKSFMEKLIMKNCTKYIIFNLFQVVGFSGNSNTIVNFLLNSIRQNIKFNLYENACRNIIDVKDLSTIASHFLDNFSKNISINIGSSRYTSVIELVNIIEDIVHIKADYELVSSGSCNSQDLSKCNLVAKENGINFDKYYAKRTIKKYVFYNTPTI